jgi:predicted RNA-binding protein YlxR (DUF448 family)
VKRALPIRMCVGCGKRSEQDRLLRFTLGTGNRLIPGPGEGRGGYVHPQRQCLQAFVNSRSGFVRSLQAVVPREMRVRYTTEIEQGVTLLP